MIWILLVEWNQFLVIIIWKANISWWSKWHSGVLVIGLIILELSHCHYQRNEVTFFFSPYLFWLCLCWVSSHLTGIFVEAILHLTNTRADMHRSSTINWRVVVILDTQLVLLHSFIQFSTIAHKNLNRWLWWSFLFVISEDIHFQWD